MHWLLWNLTNSQRQWKLRSILKRLEAKFPKTATGRLIQVRPQDRGCGEIDLSSLNADLSLDELQRCVGVDNTILLTYEFLDPVLWSAAKGNVNKGLNRQVLPQTEKSGSTFNIFPEHQRACIASFMSSNESCISNKVGQGEIELSFDQQQCYQEKKLPDQAQMAKKRIAPVLIRAP